MLADALRRGGPRPGEHRVRLRHPPPAQGRLQRAGVDRRRRVLHPPAARRRRRHHAVQLPGHGPDVDVRQRHRLRQHVRPQAVARRTRRRRCSWPTCSRQAGLPDGVFNVVQGDKVAVDRILEHPDIAAVSFVGSTPIARYIYETGTAHGKRVQALGGAKNHMVVLPDADIDMAADAAVSAGLRLGRRALHGHLGGGRRRRRRPTRWSTAIKAPARPSSRSAPAPTRQRDGPAHHPRAPRQGGRLPRQRGRATGATVVVDGRDDAGRRATASSSACRCVDDVEPRHGLLHGRDLRAGAVGVVRVDTYDEALRLVNDNPYGNGTAIFTRDGGAARQFQFDVPGRHGRRQRAHPGAGRVLQLRRLEGLAVRRHPHVRPRGHPLLHAGQGRHLPLARPGHLRGRPRLPAGR